MDKAAIVLDDTEDESPSGQPGGNISQCGMVDKPQVCPSTAGGQIKMMKRPRRPHKLLESRKRSAASARLYSQLFGEKSEDEEDKPLVSTRTSHASRSTVSFKPNPVPPRATFTPVPGSGSSSIPGDIDAFGVLSTLLSDYSQLKANHDRATASLAQYQIAQNQFLAQQDKFLAQQSASEAELARMKSKLSAAQASEQAARAAESAARQAEAKARAEVARLQKVETALKKKAPAAGKANAKAPVAAAAVSGALVARDVYISLMAETKKQYEKKAEMLKPAAAALGPPVTRIIQTNTNPLYNTARDVAFQPIASSDKAFYFDNGTTPHNPNWCKITDGTVHSRLLTLGVASTDAAGTIQSWVPTVGKSCTYSFGTHCYNVRVQSIPPLPPPPDQAQWRKDMLFSGQFTMLNASYLDQLLTQHDFAQDDKIEEGSTEVAALATLFSSFSQGFEYSPRLSQLWVKPDWLKIWLRVAKERGYNEARVLMHGMRSGEYDQLAKDVAGFDFSFSKWCRLKQCAMYGACSDDIASFYNRESRKHTDGTAVIGLLLVKPRGAGPDAAGPGAYDHYNQDYWTMYGYQCDKITLNAYAVRDQLLWLPLGLAIANRKV